MALLGSAALAMWWQIAPELRDEFEHWHSHEHFPERLALPGFRRASRWIDDDSGHVFVLYELDGPDVLSSPAYLARLNAPTPWSMRLMPHHRGMIRGQCRVVASRGSAIARHALTVRLSPAPGREAGLRRGVEAIVERLPREPGFAGAHLLQHDPPPMATTTEQRIRGGDRPADVVLIACGYDLRALQRLATGPWSGDALVELGAAPGRQVGNYTLAHSALPAEGD